MGSLFSSPKQPKVQPVETPPKEQDVSPEIAAARNRSRMAARAQFGRAGTVLTTPAGIGSRVGVSTILGG